MEKIYINIWPNFLKKKYLQLKIWPAEKWRSKKYWDLLSEHNMTTSILLTGPQVLSLERILEIIYAILFASCVSDRKSWQDKKNQTLPSNLFPRVCTVCVCICFYPSTDTKCTQNVVQAKELIINEGFGSIFSANL